MIDENFFFDQLIKNYVIRYENIRKTSSGQGDDYTTGCLLDYNYFKVCYRRIAISLKKQQALNADPRELLLLLLLLLLLYLKFTEIQMLLK